MERIPFLRFERRQVNILGFDVVNALDWIVRPGGVLQLDEAKLSPIVVCPVAMSKLVSDLEAVAGSRDGFLELRS